MPATCDQLDIRPSGPAGLYGVDLTGAPVGEGPYRVSYTPARPVTRTVRQDGRTVEVCETRPELWSVHAGKNPSWPHDTYQAALVDCQRRNQAVFRRRRIARELLDTPAPAADPRVRASWAQAVHEDVIRAGQIAGLAADHDFDSLDAYRDRVERHLAELTAGARVKVRTASATVAKILTSGRFRNQVSVRSKREGVVYNPSERRQIEHDVFGTPLDAKPADFCIYGYLAGPEPIRAGDMFTRVYGDAIWVLSEDVADRATATLGDLVANYDKRRAVPAPARALTLESVGLGKNFKPVDPLAVTTLNPFTGSVYADCQIHGQVTLADVDHLVWPAGLARAEHAGTVAALRAAGVTVTDTERS